MFLRMNNSYVPYRVGTATGCTVRIRFPVGTKDLFLVHSVNTGCGAHPPSYLMSTGALSLEVKRSGREAAHSHPSSDEAKNGGAIPPLLNTSSWHSAYLIKHRDKFTFTFYVAYQRQMVTGCNGDTVCFL
jgi:hypothetical protein